jgi:RNA polymerase sigma-70 factor (ECF subfamily)
MGTSSADHERRLAVLAGDRRAWRLWYRETFGPLDRYILWRCGGLRDVADDLIQDVWLVAVRRLEEFNPQKGSFLTWMRGIASGLLANHWRRRGRRERLPPVPLPNGESADKEVIRREQAESVARALAELPLTYEEVLRMKYLEGQTVAEIAERLGATPKAVESRLSRARAAFRLVYANEEDE